MRYVYLVRAGENQYKIGVSRNVRKRIAALQTSNINLVELICAKKTSDDSPIEKRLHKKVREFGGTGGKEWFRLKPEQALEVAIEISNAPDVDVAENIIQDLKKQIAGIVHAYENKIADEHKQLLAEREKLEELREQAKVARKKPSVIEDKEALRRVADEEEYNLAKKLVREHQHASTSFLQRRMRIGYGKAARLIERLEEDGIIGPLDGIHRSVL